MTPLNESTHTMSHTNYTHITIILDRSGSMESIRDATIAGFNAFLHAQRTVPGKATLTLVQFDSLDSYEVVHRFRSSQEVPDLTHDTFVPRHGTPLLDALGRGINDLEQGLNALAEADKPERVITAIITDGAENASREFTKTMIVDRIAEKRNDGWQFVFLRADLSAIHEARDLGVDRNSTFAFEKDEAGTTEAWTTLSRTTADLRRRRSKRELPSS